jgi:hypothetical protein
MDRRATLEFAGLGLALVLTAVLLCRLPDWLHRLGAFQALFAASFACYAVALLRLRRYEHIRYAARIVAVVAIAARLVLLPAIPSLSGDIFRYVWEGRVIVHGGNPYRQSPADPALASLRENTIYPNVNHPGLATIYPPLAEAGFALVARVAPTVRAMKLWVLLHDVALVLVLLRWARRRGESPARVIAYAWNPLVLVEYAGAGHNDPTALLWLATALMLARERPRWSALALAAGVLTKLAPLAALPFLWRQWPWRARLIATAVLGAGLAWFWAETRVPGSGLTAYWSTWRNNELAFDLLERISGSFTGGRILSVAGIALVAGAAWWRHWHEGRATRTVLRAATLLSPVMHPWYLGWTLMLEPLGPSAAWVLLSFTAVLNYGVLATPAAGGDFHAGLAVRAAEYGVPLLCAMWLAVRARTARHS